MADISGITGNWNTYGTSNTAEKSDTLGKDDFLKLLVAQLTNQDPTNPMQDTEFVSQLATYSGLEQQMNMNKNLETLIAVNATTTATSAVGLIGKVVGYTDDNGVPQLGQVAFLDIVEGQVFLYLTDDKYIPLGRVEQVAEPAKDDGKTGEEDD